MSLNTILATTPLTSTGYHLKATGTTIGNSLIWDNGTNVGIGNTNTSYKFDVTGTARFTDAIRIGTDFAQLLPISASNYQLLVGNYYDGTNIIATATAGSRTVYNVGGMDFRTFTGATVGNTVADTSRMVVTSAGNVGIGVTPQWTLSGYKTLELADVGLIYAGNGNNAFVNNGYFDSTWKYKTTAAGTLYATDGGAHSFYTVASGTAGTLLSWVERMRITSDGRVLIGVTTNPAGGALAVASNGVVVYAGANYRQMYQSGTAMYWFNGSNEAYLSSAGVWTNASDISIKKDINDIKYGLNEVIKLKPKCYKMIDDDLEQIGFIAQDIEEVLPELVSTSDRGMKGLSYGNLTAVLTKAIQEMNTKLDEQNQTIQNLQEQINILAK